MEAAVLFHLPLEPLEVRDPDARITLNVLNAICTSFDPRVPSDYPAVRAALTALLESCGG